MLQVAFGSDFSQPWSDEALGLKHAKGDGTLGFLIDHSFRGVQIGYRNPFHFVSTCSFSTVGRTRSKGQTSNIRSYLVML